MTITSVNILITGASSGIGLAAARHAITRGARVFGSVRRTEDAERLSGELGARFTPLLFDVTDAAAIRAGVAEMQTALNGAPLDGLVNNAGVALAGPLLHQPIDEWRRVIEVNLIGVMQVTQIVTPLLMAQNGARAGRIVNISSVSGEVGWPMLSAYAASKHGLEGLSDALRRELMLHGIDVIVIGPGSVKTPIWEKARQHDVSAYARTPYAEAFKRYAEFIDASETSGIPVERVGELIWHALTTRAPRARYAPTPGPLLSWLIARLPKRLLDRLAAGQMGLAAKDGRRRTTDDR
jgi:NAD(P)-dependent dehydrogenase (short-subunit alcohol dehydrogenase family)